tara:strand:+ start:500 stop:745 length:246 start_codon:yes stop_codon:yes gene_type:complete
MSDDKSCSNRFNSFHLEVSILSGRMGWLLDKLITDHFTEDTPGLELLHQIHVALESLIEQQDCLSDPVATVDTLPLASSAH